MSRFAVQQTRRQGGWGMLASEAGALAIMEAALDPNSSPLLPSEMTPSLLGVGLDGRSIGSGIAPRHGVYAIFDPRLSPAGAVSTPGLWANAVLSSVPCAIQLRAKGAGEEQRRSLAELLLPLCRRREVPLIINDDLKLALALARRHGPGSAGLHLGQGDALELCARDPAARWRSELEQAGVWVGLSTHSLQQVCELDADLSALTKRDGSSDGRDVEGDNSATQAHSAASFVLQVRPHYLGFGPIFSTLSKQDAQPVTGLSTLAKVCAASHRPVVAIGGISLVSAAQCRLAGAASVAVIGALAAPTVGEIADLAGRL